MADFAVIITGIKTTRGKGRDMARHQYRLQEALRDIHGFL